MTIDKFAKKQSILKICLFLLIGATQATQADTREGLSFLIEHFDTQNKNIPETDPNFLFIINSHKKNAKIKSIVHYKLDEHSKVGNLKYKKHATKSFDKRGNLLMEEDYKYNTRSVYTYNKHGLLSKQKDYTEDFKNPQRQIFTKYDAKGRINESTLSETQTQTTLKTIYSYDNDGHMIAKTTYSGNKIVEADSAIYKNGNLVYQSNLYMSAFGSKQEISRNFFEYNSKNNQVMWRNYKNEALKLIRFSDFDANGKTLNEYKIATAMTPISEYEECSKVTYMYDGQGVLQCKKVYKLKSNGLASYNGDRSSLIFSDTTLLGEIRYKYNDKGNCVEMSLYTDGVLQMQYLYNEAGQTTSIYVFPEFKEEYFYDANGKLQERTEEKSNGYRTTKSFSKYKYDANGNNTEIMNGTEGYSYYETLNFAFDKYGNLTEASVTEADSSKRKDPVSAVMDKLEYIYYK